MKRMFVVAVATLAAGCGLTPERAATMTDSEACEAMRINRTYGVPPYLVERVGKAGGIRAEHVPAVVRGWVNEGMNGSEVQCSWGAPTTRAAYAGNGDAGSQWTWIRPATASQPYHPEFVFFDSRGIVTAVQR